MTTDPSATLAGIRENNERVIALCGMALAVVRQLAEHDMPRAVAAVEAVLKLADDWEAKARKIGGQIKLGDCDGATAGFKMIGYQNHRAHAAALRAAITAKLTGTGKEGSNE